MRDDTRQTTPREVVGVQFAAHFLGVHEDTVLRLIAAEKLVAFKVGRLWRIHRSELKAYVDRNASSRRASAN